ncbi:hypothetical protein R3P38DRAFT_2764191 [Favolaschia claudopus]|uniref:Uncharacterized protein n=1 Tax=Favolaschia claudopus TaxID=2862362 RepID=A0AAW0D9W5_9AGAR
MAKISRRARAKASAGVEAAASSPSTYKLQRGPPVPNARRKPTLKTPRRDVLLGNGRTLVQPHVLPKKKLPRINFSASSETERNATDNFDPSASSAEDPIIRDRSTGASRHRREGAAPSISRPSASHERRIFLGCLRQT